MKNSTRFFLLPLLICLLAAVEGWGQTPTNGGFENGVTSWTTAGTAGTTNARTGSNALIHTTSSTSNVPHTNSTTISVPNNSYGHVIGWAIGNNANSRASCGGTLNATTSSTTFTTIGTTLTQLIYTSAQNVSGSAQNFSCRVNTRSATGSVTIYWDDVIMYTSTASTPDLTKPVAATGFTNGTITSGSVQFTWTNGSDAATGIQNTIILRTTNTSASTPVMNDQGVYTASPGTATVGPHTVGAWTILSISVGSGTSTFTDNSVSSSTDYKYAVIHRDLAYNYSAALVSGTITTPSAGSAPVVTSNSASGTYGTTFTTYNITASNTPTGYGASGLPTGLSVNTTTGAIDGTPTQFGSFSVDISATNAFGTGNGTLSLTISKKALTIAGISISGKEYDGNTTASITGTPSLVGVYGSDVVTVDATSASAVFNSASVDAAAPTTVSGYALGGAQSGNYTLTQPTGLTAAITAKALTINSAAASNKVYDRTNSATITGTLNGIIGSDNVTLNGTGTFASVTVANNIGVTSTSTLSGAQAGNYSLTQPTGLQANITPKALTISGAAANNKVFDGNTNATVSGTLSGVVNPDVVTLNGTGTFVSSAIGNGIAVTSTSTLSGADAGNYTLTQPTGLTANITPPSIWTNPITAADPSASNPFTTGNVVASNITVSGIGRGSGISASSASNRFSATGWNQPSLDANDYFYFTLTPDAGYQINFNSFVYTGQASGTGPTSFQFGSSLDGYSASVGTPTATGATIDLSGSTYQTITSAITFRLFGWDASAGGGTFSVNDFAFYGTITAASCTPPTLSASTSTANVGNTSIDITSTISTIGSGAASITTRGIEYSVNSNLSSSSPSSETGTYTATGFTKTVSGLIPNTFYYYRGYAINDCGSTGYSHTSGFPTFTTKHNAPNIAAESAVTACGFTAKWTAPNTPAGSATFTYTLEYSTDGTFSSGVTSVTGISSSTLSQVIASLNAGTVYHYRVMAVNAGGNSAYSAVEDVTTSNSTTASISGSPFCVTSATGATFNVSFTSIGAFAAGNQYNVELSNSSGSFASPTVISPTPLASTANSETISVTIPANTSTGSGYLIRVTSTAPAVSGCGFNASAAFSINLGPNNATWNSSPAGNAQVTLNWNSPTPTTCYTEVIVIASPNAISGTPSNTYTANSVYGSGTAMLGGYVVYAGTGTTQLVTNLTNGQQYNFRIYTRYGNDWSTGNTVQATPNNNPTAILRFEMSGLAGNETTKSYDFAAAGVSTTSPSGVLSRGAGLGNPGVGNANRFNADAWETTNSVANAITNNKYFEFSIAPEANYFLTITSILFNFQISTLGPSQVALRSSLDNYAANLYSTAVTTTTTTYNTGNLSGFTNLTQTVTFRLYGYNASSSGTGGIESNSGYDLDVMGYSISNDAEINVKVGPSTGSVSVASAGTYDFGVYKSGTNSVAITFRVENLGNAPLLLNGSPNKVAISGTNASDFTIVQSSLSGTINGNSNSSFTVTFNATGANGARSAQLSIDNSDITGGEDPYIINLTAEVGVVPVINEFVADHIGTDDHELIEMLGAASTDYSGNMSIVVVKGDGGAIGTINKIFSPGTTSASGYWWTGYLSGQLQNGTITLMLVMNSTAVLNQDLDTDDNGTLDVTPWTRIIDDVSLRVSGSDKAYSATIIAPNFDGTFLTPGGASRIPNGTDSDVNDIDNWMRNDFDGWGLTGFTGTAHANEAKNTPNTVNVRFNVWKGGTVGFPTDWNTVTNWEVGVPNSTTLEALIPSVSNYPTIPGLQNYDCFGLYLTSTASNITINAGGVIRNYSDFESNSNSTSFGDGMLSFEGSSATKISGNLTIGEVTINNSFGVTIQLGATVNIIDKLVLESGQLTNNGTLKLKSNSAKTAYIDDFTDPTPGTLSGNVTIERYVPAGVVSNFHYIGSASGGNATMWTDDFSNGANTTTDNTKVTPKADCDPLHLAAGSAYGNLFSYNESLVSDCYLDGWEVRTTAAVANRGEGFAAIISGGTVIDETGNYSNAAVTVSTLSITSGNNQPTSKGFHFVANPFFAPIQWNLLTGTNLYGTAYRYNPNTGTYGTYNNISGSGIISTNEAFFVRGNNLSQSSFSITFPSAARVVNSNNTLLRQQQSYAYGLKVKVEADNYADEALIAFDSLFTSQEDNGYDAIKLLSSPGIPSIYVLDSASDRHCILALPQNTQMVPLGVLFQYNGQHVFTFDDINSFPATSLIFLEDLLSGTWTNLRLTNTYTFSANIGDNPDRFVLHFTPPIQMNIQAATCVGSDGQFSFQLPSGIDWSFIVKNQTGAVIARQTGNGILSVINALPVGNYAVTFIYAGSYQVTETLVITGVQQVNADFVASVDNPVVAETIQFTNSSAGVISYEWNFGDGTTASGVNNPTHSYQVAGTYIVSLSAKSMDCEDVQTKEIQVFKEPTVGLDNQDVNHLSVFAYEGSLYVKFDFPKTEVAEIVVNNILGQQIYGGRISTDGLKRIKLQGAESTQYLLVSIKTSSEVFVKKVFLPSLE